MRARGQLAEQSRLPDARLAAEQHQPPVPGGRGREMGLEFRELALAPDEDAGRACATGRERRRRAHGVAMIPDRRAPVMPGHERCLGD